MNPRRSGGTILWWTLGAVTQKKPGVRLRRLAGRAGAKTGATHWASGVGRGGVVAVPAPCPPLALN
jgi:hypothetical protein